MTKSFKTFAAVSVLSASALASGAAFADFTGNIGVTSDYIWRGETQSGDTSAVSGGLDYSHESGVYVGTWVSSLAGNGEYEQDLYAGYSGEAAGIGYDVGYISYQYPKDGNDADFGEVYVGGSYQMFSAMYSYSDDYLGSGDSAYYLEVGADFDVKDGLMLGAHYGMKDGDAFADGYGDYSVSLSKDDFAFTYSNTDNDKVPQSDNARVAVSWSKSFDL